MLTVNDGLGFASRMSWLSPSVPTMRFCVVGLYQDSTAPWLPTASDGLWPPPVPGVTTGVKLSVPDASWTPSSLSSQAT